jgi:hypothetical protein
VPLDSSDIAATVLEQVIVLACACQARVHLLTVGVPFPGESGDIEAMQFTGTFQSGVYNRRCQPFNKEEPKVW